MEVATAAAALAAVAAVVVVCVLVVRRWLVRKYAVPRGVWASRAEPCFRDFSKPGAPLTRFRVLAGCDTLESDESSGPSECATDSAPAVKLSVVIPAYNEQERLPRTLEQYGAHLAARAAQDRAFTYEILVVDDGSRTDGTAAAAEAFALKHSGAGHDVRLLRLQRNRGKGGAVKRGVLCARGDVVLFADADGATAAEDLSHVYDALVDAQKKQGAAVVVVGTRPVRQDEGRRLLSEGFRLLVRVLCVRGVEDTQCGFKAFSREAAAALFPRLHVERWAFDVELLLLAQRLGMAVLQRVVTWHDVEGSTLDPLRATAQMACDLVRIRLLYDLRVWTLGDPALARTKKAQ